MAVICELLKFTNRCESLKKSVLFNGNSNLRRYCTFVQEPRSKRFKGIVKFSLVGAALGTAVGVIYSTQKINKARDNLALEGTQVERKILLEKPPIPASRSIISPVDSTNLDLTLYQYQSCPFCCKVRALLDYYGVSYDIVEVNPVFRTEAKWSSYKKVPILLAKVNGGYQPLNDSSMIISLIASYFHDSTNKIEELIKFYPSIALHDDKGKFQNEIVNKYFLMYQNSIPKDMTLNDIVEERKWRKWADDVLVHTLSPNAYRTLDESYRSFEKFSKVGNWEEYFPFWQRWVMINVGAVAMWWLGDRLKRKYQLKEDVRQSLYDEVTYWLRGIKARGGPFMGGQNPDLSDLSVYGILNSIEGLEAFNDTLANTKLSTWYYAMKEKVESHAGNHLINS